MAALATARAVHAANQKRVLDLVSQRKEARAAFKVSGDAVAKEVREEEKKKLAKLLPKPPAKPKVDGATKVNETKKHHLKPAVCKPVAPVKRGRPSSGECNACKRLMLGLKGGKPHTCGRVPYSRIG